MAFHSTRKLWGRVGVPAVVAVLSLGAAWTIRQTHGSLIVDLYAFISSPFRPKVDVDVALSSAANRELQAQVDELEFQNRLLRELLDIQRRLGDDGAAAPVVGRNADRWWHQLTLGKGTSDGVVEGHVVMAPGGLVGRIQTASANTSRVLLISDPSSQLGVTLGGSRAMGIMRGLGSQQAIVELFERTPDIQVGDTVMTSGLSSLYPGGIPIGHVSSLDLRASPAPEAIVELSAPLNRLEWGLIYSFQSVSETPPTTDTPFAPEENTLEQTVDPTARRPAE